VKDNAAEVSVNTLLKADAKNIKHIGAQMPGTVGEIKVTAGAHVRAGETLMITEAMKMETSVQTPVDAVVKHIHVTTGTAIQTGDLLVEFE